MVAHSYTQLTMTFYKMFTDCVTLQSVPAELFVFINLESFSGSPAQVWREAFSYCTGLTALGKGMFPVWKNFPNNGRMFQETFHGCVNLEGWSASLNDERLLYEAYPNLSPTDTLQCYTGCTQLFDYSEIPYAWK
jgi:hypothetical protein